DVPDVAVVNAFDGLDIAGPVTPLRARRYFKVLLLRLFVSRIDDANSRTVDGHRFFHENVFARFDTGFEIGRPKPRRSRQNRVIHARHFQRLFVSVESTETFVVGDAEVIFGSSGFLREHVSHGNDLSFHIQPFAGVGEVAPRAAAASAYANDD